jgi:uncharacterized protein YdhG (YjbR/CyaY superfamily)
MVPSAASFDDYIAGLPTGTQEVLQEMRRRVHAALPDAEERISYGIPTFAIDGQYVIYIAGWRQHVSIYPVPEDVPDLEPYLSGRGTVKLPLNRPIPWDLVDRAIAARVRSRRAS